MAPWVIMAINSLGQLNKRTIKGEEEGRQEILLKKYEEKEASEESPMDSHRMAIEPSS